MTGEQFIKPIKDSIKAQLLEKNVIQISKSKDGVITKVAVNTESNIIKLAAQLGSLDLTSSYGVPAGLAETMDVAAQVAVAAGFEALKAAGLVSGRSNDPSEWILPEEFQERTGIVYASSFPAMDAAIGEVMRFLQSKTINATDTQTLVSSLRRRLENAHGNLTKEDIDALEKIQSLSETVHEIHWKGNNDDYLFDRKFLFRVLVLGNAQLAQLTGCRGPNTQTNAACAGTTQVHDADFIIKFTNSFIFSIC
jgi:3-oxoacyl-(acyl-carrier-protein) synthase